MRELDPRICRCPCHRDGDEDHHECCFRVAAIERDAAEAKLAARKTDCDNCEEAFARSFAAQAKLARCVELAHDGQNRDALHAFDALLKIERLAAAKGE